MLYNTAPRIDFLPTDLELTAGESLTLYFGKPFDFEGNDVAVDSITARSEEGSADFYDNWLTLYNSTVIERVKIDIKVPDDAVADDIVISIIFKDNHRIGPAYTEAKIYVTVNEKVIEEVNNFDIDAFRAKTETKEVSKEQLPPPILEISDMDNEGRINFAFSQKVVFSLQTLVRKRSM